jgi:hypothetical protein
MHKQRERMTSIPSLSHKAIPLGKQVTNKEKSLLEEIFQIKNEE